MLDNKEINEQFAREGWEKMRQVLDVEMPVNAPRKKRPVFWVWLQATGIAASLLLSVTGLWWIMAKESDSIAGKNDVNAVTTPASTAETKEVVALEGAKTSNTPAVKTPIPDGLLSKTNGQVIKRQQSIANHAPVNLTNPGQYSELLLTHSNPLSDVPSASVQPTVANQDEGVIAPEALISVEKNAPVTAPLPGLTSNALPLKESPMSVQPLPVSKPAASWRHGPEIGGITSFPASLTGFHAGWAAEIPVSGQLSVRGGLRYDFQRQTVSRNDRVLLRESASADLETDPFNPIPLVTSSFDQADTVGISTLKMHYVAMPLSISWKLSARWRAESGVQVAYLLRAFRESRDLSNSFDSTGNTVNLDNRSQSWFFSNNAQEVAQASFQPWDLALSGGIRYQISRHWNVGLSGNFGLLNQAHKSNGYRIFNRNAVLSMGYYF